MSKPIVVIIGAGPAGLTAAMELVRDGRMHPLVLETSQEVGGISRTVEYKGNRMDIGGHRFFSKSDWVMKWWREILPIATNQQTVSIAYQGKQRTVDADAASCMKHDRVMLVRDRLSRIYFLRKYFDYPIKLNATTIGNLGFVRLMRAGVSYVWAMLFPRRPERSLEDFLINRFGGELYRTFFKDYTEKVWGVACDQISAEWGAQRIKGLSILEALRHAWRTLRGADSGAQAIKTSLIEHFLYPRLGPGQLWQEVARQISEQGGEIRFGQDVFGIRHGDGRALAVLVKGEGGESLEIHGDFVISTMPIKDLVAGMQPPAPEEVGKIAAGLPYRDFITVGLLVSRMRANRQSQSARSDHMPPDNWIYIQDRDVRIGRLQIFNNWSPDLVADESKVWLGLEYFCQEGDDLWSMDDASMKAFAAAELEKIDMIDQADVLDGTVIRVPKTYPAYFGAYEKFPQLRGWIDGIENLFLVGRNGMHRYNNQDHSMLTAKLAVECILEGRTDKSAIWAVNVDDDYHEEVETRG
ncbi:MAG: NAD(P)/FAD-dependent oxidoreductase [Burkholderiaceae bacterium]|nr:NAD(P)/FAD-dependent oxidoreductase [Sulfuritalea sp.]MCF8176097.1 NAD(P)/FAD-dependent oxidoreductase [Burkholderiaceae bacterium]MCF8184890.1 NAD(P)/FAD-dependent oxidoreductase [Polynucleobacter sp.]